MPIQSKYEETQDVQKVVMRTITKQDTSEFDPSEGVRSYRKEQVDGIWTVTEEYLFSQGHPQFQLDATTTTDPLELHPVFDSTPQQIRTNWLYWKKNPTDPYLATKGEGGKAWNPADEPESTFQTFYGLYSGGFESYLSPRLMVRMTELEDGPADAGNVGKIDTPPDPFSGYGDGFFILSAARGIQEGDKWRNTYEWMGAGPSGHWDQLIYGV